MSCRDNKLEEWLDINAENIIKEQLNKKIDEWLERNKEAIINSMLKKKELNINKVEKSENRCYSLEEGAENKIDLIKSFLKECENSNDEKVTVDMNTLKRLISKLLTLFERNEELKTKIDNLENDINKLESNKNSLIKDIESFNIEKNSLEREKAGLLNENNRLEIEKRELLNEKRGIEENIESLLIEKNNLETEQEKLIIEKRELEEARDRLTNEKISLEKENKKITEEKDKLEERLIKVKDLEILQSLYEKYLKLSPTYRESLKDLIKSDSVGNFISCCYNIGILDDLWDSLSREVKNKNNFDDANILEDIFKYFILQQNNRYSESLYKILIPEIGEEYNPTKHMSVNGKNSGQIEKVIFPGYGSMEKKTDPNQSDEDREFNKVRKVAMVIVD